MGRKKKTRDFQKVKIKVGKKLQKPNETSTAFKAKKVVLLDQLKNVDHSKTVSRKQLNLGELCQHARHYNANVRKDAMIGFKEILLQQNYDQIKADLKTFVEYFLLLAFDADFDVRAQTLTALKCLFEKIKPNDLTSLFHLIVAHVVCASTDLNLSIKLQSIKLMDLLIERTPELCSGNWNLLKSFADLLVGTNNNNAVDKNKKALLVRGLFRILNLNYRSSKHENDTNSTSMQDSLSTVQILNPKKCSFLVKRRSATNANPFDCPITTDLFFANSYDEIRSPANLNYLITAVVPFCNSFWIEITTFEADSSSTHQITNIFDAETLQSMLDVLKIYALFIKEIGNADACSSLEDGELLKSNLRKYFGNRQFLQRYASLFPCQSKRRNAIDASGVDVCCTVNLLLCEVCHSSKLIDNDHVSGYVRKLFERRALLSGVKLEYAQSVALMYDIQLQWTN